MEIIIGIVFVILILLLTGLDIGWIIMGIAGLTALAALFTAVFFAVCWVMLLRSEKKSARFVRFESGQRFESAVYLIDGSEYGNVFPAEFVMRGKLYRSDREVTVRLARRSRRVFDRKPADSGGIRRRSADVINLRISRRLFYHRLCG